MQHIALRLWEDVFYCFKGFPWTRKITDNDSNELTEITFMVFLMVDCVLYLCICRDMLHEIVS